VKINKSKVSPLNNALINLLTNYDKFSPHSRVTEKNITKTEADTTRKKYVPLIGKLF
jgi:hypothetical protein